MYSGTDHKYTEPGGSLRGKLLGALVLLGGHLEPICRPNSTICIISWPMSPLLAAKKGLDAILSDPIGHTLDIK